MVARLYRESKDRKRESFKSTFDLRERDREILGFTCRGGLLIVIDTNNDMRF